MDLQKQINELRDEVKKLRRIVIESKRELGPLRNVATIAEVRKLWPVLIQSKTGLGYLTEWYWLFSTHVDDELRLDQDDSDKLWGAILKAWEK